MSFDICWNQLFLVIFHREAGRGYLTKLSFIESNKISDF